VFYVVVVVAMNVFVVAVTGTDVAFNETKLLIFILSLANYTN
jgi:hypothetical protein